MKKFLAILMIIVALFVGCSKPTTPPAEPPVVEISKPLTIAMNLGCTLTKGYILFDGQWATIKKYVPAAITGQIIPIANTFAAALKLYDSAVITWFDTKSEPSNFLQLRDNLLKLKDDLMPLIAKIQEIIKQKQAAEKAVQPIDEVMTLFGAVKSEKGLFTCTIDDLKALNEQLAKLPAIS
jgi:hypothetical protein